MTAPPRLAEAACRTGGGGGGGDGAPAEPSKAFRPPVPCLGEAPTPRLAHTSSSSEVEATR
jgi:hypothetical protein